MIINRDKKFLIITPPKTGSRITEDCFNNRYDLPVARHAPLYIFQKYINVDSYFKILLVRNPWDWMVSRYFHYLFATEEVNKNNLSFTDWFDSENRLNINDLPEYYAEDFHDMGRDLNYEFDIDLILRMENLKEGINKIQKKFYLFISDEIPFFKSNRNEEERDYKNFYTGREDIIKEK
jgi:hypothetical protein